MLPSRKASELPDAPPVLRLRDRPLPRDRRSPAAARSQQVVGGPPAESNGLQPVGPADPCGAGRLQGLVGQDAAAANSAALPAEYRILYPDMSAGTGFVQDRVTIRVDGQNHITSVQCG